MIMSKSKADRKAAKKAIRNQMKRLGIILKDVCARSVYHYNTVVTAFDPEHKHWNQTLINTAIDLIEEKKKELEETKQSILNK